MIPRRPQAIISRSSGDLTSAEAAVARLEVALGSCGSHDALYLIAWADSKLADLSPGETLAVSLGDAGSEELVWSGEVTRVEQATDGVVIEGLAPTAQLSHSWKSETYLSQSIADIVSDLASTIDTDEVKCDMALDTFTVDDRRSVWAHLRELARLADAELSCSAEGGVRFVPVRTGGSDLTLRYGAEVIGWQVGPALVGSSSGMAPLRSASESGQEKWHWWIREPSASGSAEGPLRVVGAFSTRDAADALEQALSDRAKRQGVRGSIKAVGQPEARPGILLAVDDLPGGDPGALRVLAVTHHMDGQSGFTSTIEVEGTGEGAIG